MSTHEIVILGANMGGVSAAQYLLKQTIPALKALDSSKTYHVTLVGPSTSYFYKIAAPRALIGPELIKLEQAIIPLADGFSKYPASEYSFVQGFATAVDPSSKTVTVTLADKTTQALPYNSLVVATGTTADPLWSINDDGTETLAAFAHLHSALPTAKTVLIAGGGPVGVETTGEIACKFPNAKTTLLSGGDRLLQRLSAGTGNRASSVLHNLNVTVTHNLKVKSVQAGKDSTTLQFDNGTTETVDVYIDATGGSPNTAFLPASWLDERKRVIIDEAMRGPEPGVYAIGDASSTSLGGAMDIMNSTAPLGGTLGKDIADTLTAVGARNQAAKVKVLQEKKYKPMKDTQLVPVGRNKGVGQIMGYWFPSILVWLLKGRTYFIEKARPSVLGADFE